MDEDFEADRRGMPKPLLFIVGILSLLFLVWLAIVINSFDKQDSQADAEREEEEAMLAELEPGVGDDHGLLRFATDISAKPVPVMIPLYEVPESLLSKKVIGISVGEIHHAYMIDQGSARKNLFLFSTSIGTTPIIALHNYRQEKTFVYSSDETEMIDVAFGGYDGVNNIILKFNTIRLVQDSDKIPFDPYPFEVMTLQQWSELHPETLVNIDETKSSKDYFDTE